MILLQKVEPTSIMYLLNEILKVFRYLVILRIYSEYTPDIFRIYSAYPLKKTTDVDKNHSTSL